MASSLDLDKDCLNLGFVIVAVAMYKIGDIIGFSFGKTFL